MHATSINQYKPLCILESSFTPQTILINLTVAFDKHYDVSSLPSS